MISWVSEMYPTAVSCLFWVLDSVSEACRFWLPWHILRKSLTITTLCNLLPSTTLFFSLSFLVFEVYNVGLLPAKIPILAWATCFKMSFWRRIWPEVVQSLPQKMSRGRNKVANARMPCCTIEDISGTLLETLFNGSAACEVTWAGWPQLCIVGSILALNF